MEKSQSEPKIKTSVGPHHMGVLGVRKMKHFHSCPQCFNHEEGETFIVNVCVLWPGMSDIHIACCRRCMEKIQCAAVGELF